MPLPARRVVVTMLAALALLATGTAAYAAGSVTVVNGTTASPWIKFDAAGNGLDAHDGEIIQSGASYYFYGTSYDCGYIRWSNPVTPFCGFVVYRSPDLRHWTLAGAAHDSVTGAGGYLFDPHGTSPTDWQGICNSRTNSCYRPHVLHDSATGRWVLWVNTYDVTDGVQRGYHVLTSTSRVGPFTEAVNSSGHAVVPKLFYPTGGDFDLFTDNDKSHSGYIVYTVRKDPLLGKNYGYELVIERLNSSDTSGSGAYTTLDTSHTESPSMFKRGRTYYITMSDPNCAYCGSRDGKGRGTGATYLQATSPLGPWRGAGGSSVALSPGRMYVEGAASVFRGPTTTTADQLSTLKNYEVVLKALPLPDTKPWTTKHYRQVGWMFRATDTNNGYLWVLSNRAYNGAPSRLTKYVLESGKTVRKTVAPVNLRLSGTTDTVVRMLAYRSTIKTMVNGKVVDRVRDRTYSAGYAGIRQFGYTPTDIDYFAIIRPKSLGYHFYAGDNFREGSFIGWPTFRYVRRHGVTFSTDSCGGQPADVARLRAPVTSSDPYGAVYLFQSDRWDNRDQNEGQALQYWHALSFGSAGNIRTLPCTATSTMTLTYGSTASSPGPDETYNVVQNIVGGSSPVSHAQVFTAGAAGTVTGLSFVAFQSDVAKLTPDAGLTVSLDDFTGSAPGTQLWSTTLDPASVGFAPRSYTVTVPSVPLVAGQQYALVFSTTSGQGRYGVARSDGTLDAGVPGDAWTLRNGTWTKHAGRDLKTVLTTA